MREHYEKFKFSNKTSSKIYCLILSCVFMVTLPSTLWAQERNISGSVKDANTGETLIGVSVAIEGTTKGTMTDMEGRFTINAASGETLVISYIGFVAQKVAVTAQTSTLDIKLEENTQKLDEVVIVGFGTQKKVNLTGSVGVVDSKAFEDRPVQNAVQALQGAVAGLNISTQGLGGTLNAGMSVNVRGTGTIGENSSGSPLVLIDGIEGDLNSVNPQDIDNISVLKDAASAAVYGSRAPFGVILVTTKSGKSGKTKVNYNNSFQWSSPVLRQRMMNSYEFVNYWNDTDYNGGGSGQKYKPDFVQRVKDYMDGNLDPWDVVLQRSDGKWDYDYTNANVDWMKEYYRDSAPSQEHTISISGGSEDWTYYLSGNYLDKEGLMRYGTDTYERYATTLKLSGKIVDNLKLDYSGRFTRTNYNRATTMADGFYDHIMRRARPNRAIIDPNGYYMSDINYIDALQNGGRRKEEQDWYTQQMKLTYSPLKNWNIIGEINYRIYNNNVDENAYKVYSYMADGVTPYVSLTSVTDDYVYNYNKKSYLFSPNVYSNYSLTLNEKHNFSVMGGFQAEKFRQKIFDASRKGLITTDIPVINQTTDATPTVSGYLDRWATVGFFGRLNYDYEGKYLFEANLRYDGTSRFRKDQRWNWFPSFSAGWNIAYEDFWQPIAQYVNTLKLRMSYGRLGNQNTNSWYPTYQTISTGTVNGGWLVNGAKPNTSSAPGLISTTLTWEKVRSWNFGLDWGLFNNRLTGSVDGFVRYTDDGMGPGPTLPATLGTDVPKINNVDIRTHGFELSISWRDKIRDFSYGATFNLSDSRTKVINYYNPTGSIDQYLPNRYLGEIWGYTTVGIAKTQAEMDAHLASMTSGGQDALGNRWGAGDIMYKDIDENGKVNGGARTLDDKGDLRVIGNNTPRYAVGIGVDLAYKGFDFNMFWQGILKRDYYAGGMMFWGVTGSGEWWSTAMKPHLNYFRDENSPSADALGVNTDAYYPRPVWGDKNQKTQSKYLLDASYLRLKNIQFGYTIPTHITQKAMISRLRVFFSGENLLTITDLNKTLDPESIGIGRQGGTTYPLQKTISFGLNVTF